jgi:hypothetical protein
MIRPERFEMPGALGEDLRMEKEQEEQPVPVDCSLVDLLAELLLG